MKNPYVLKLFERFSKKDMKEFGKFVSSPYHNNRTVLIRFYAILSKYILSDSEIPSKKLLFNEMYPGKKYNADIIDKLYSFLYKLSKEFLVLNSLKSDKEFSKLRLLKCLDKYGTDSVFEKELNSTEKFIQNQKIGNSLYYWKSELEDIKSQYYNYRAIISKGAPSVQMHASYLISDFLQKLLNSLYNFHSFKTLKGIELGDSLFKHFIDNFALNKFILKLSDDNSEDNELLIYNYYSYLLQIDSDKQEYYSKLKKYLLGNKDKLGSDNLSDLFTTLEWFCVKKIKSNNNYFLNEIFELYEEHFKLVPADIGDANDFINYVQYGIKLKKINLIEKFIKDNSDKLPSEIRYEVTNRSYALLYFEKKDWDKALGYLMNIKRIIHTSEKMIRSLYIKIYYELNRFDQLFAAIDSFRHYLDNDAELSEKVRTNNKKNINYLQKLAKMKLSDNTDGINKVINDIKKDLSSLDAGISGHWLLEKAEKLDKQFAMNNE